MKKMKQMHKEILDKARWDGGWPRVICVGPGIIALARDQAHYEELRRSRNAATLSAVITGLAIGAAPAIWMFAT